MKQRKIRVVVLFGGCSDEYEVSLKSAYAIITNLDQEKYETITVGITRDGRWLRYRGDAASIRNDAWALEADCVPAFFSPSTEFRGLMEMKADGKWQGSQVDVVFPALHGACGEDGTLQGLLTMAGIPFVGCSVLSSAAGMDKSVAHKLAAAAGVAVTRSAVFHRRDDVATIVQGVWKFQYPLYVKPANGGSSLGLTMVPDPTLLLRAVERAFQYDFKIVIEESVKGFEVGCAVLGTEELILGVVDELQLHGTVFDYQEKYSMTKTVHHVPARISGELMDTIKKDAIKVYRALECKGIARVDFFLTPESQVVFNEINTMPGFTAGSRYPKMIMATGITFAQLLDRLIEEPLQEEEGRKEREKEGKQQIQAVM